MLAGRVAQSVARKRLAAKRLKAAVSTVCDKLPTVRRTLTVA